MYGDGDAVQLGAPAADRRAARRREGGRGVAAVREDVRHRVVGQAPRDDGRDADRSLRQPEHRVHRPVGEAEGAAARRARRARATRSTTPRATGCRRTARACSSSRSTACRASGYDRAAAAGPDGVRVPRDPPRRVEHGRVRLRDARPLDAHPLAAPGRHRRRGRRSSPAFALVVPDDVPESRLPTDEELRLIREVLDPANAACRRGARLMRR